MPHRLKQRFVAHVLIIIIAPAIFGLVGFLYSFFGYVQNEKLVIFLEPFRSLTIQEIGGHFAFGFLAALPAGNLRICIISGLMTLTMDADHILNIARVPVLTRVDHSILFAGLSSIIVGYLSTQVVASVRRNQIESSAFAEGTRFKRENKTRSSVGKNPSIYISHSFYPRTIFLQFSIITAVGFMSHIAYDTVVDENARFPLFDPFSFALIMIPRVYGLAIEASAALLVYFVRGRFKLSF